VHSNYINEEYASAPGAMGDLKGSVDALLTSYYRGKISKEQMEAQAAALKAQAAKGSPAPTTNGMSQYMPMIMIGGAVLIVILVLRKR